MILRGDELVLKALKQEYKRLCKIAEKAKKEAYECIHVGSEAIAIRKELNVIIESKKPGKETLEALNKLKARQERVNELMKKDLVKVFDKESESEFQRDECKEQIAIIEFRLKRRK